MLYGFFVELSFSADLREVQAELSKRKRKTYFGIFMSVKIAPNEQGFAQVWY
jgi:hypothetical protein